LRQQLISRRNDRRLGAPHESTTRSAPSTARPSSLNPSSIAPTSTARSSVCLRCP
jgi:hypothetical protein